MTHYSRRSRGRLLLCFAPFGMLLAVGQCEGGAFIWEHEKKDRVDLGVAPQTDETLQSPARKDTIGAYTYYEGLTPMRVRGYGLVVGLGENGARDCPKHIFDQLVQEMYKQHRFGSSEVGVKAVTPEELIRSADTAVVAVYGEIHAGALKGDAFDVVVRALPGTQTTSLRGGTLLPTELQVFRTVEGRGTISGQTLARALGPVFLNPFADEGAATRSTPLEGMVLGGARAVQDRRIRLVLSRPSYPMAKRIQDRVNARLPAPHKVADAISPSFIQLYPPPEFQTDVGHFLALIPKLYLSYDPGFATKRIGDLSRELQRPDAPHAEIALCFEGIGRAALPVLKDLYEHPKDYVHFHAAVAGLRLEDHLACDVIAAHAENSMSAYRFPAIRALGEAKGMPAAAPPLRRLLADSDPRVQVAACEALIQRQDAGLDTTIVGRAAFWLHRVPESPTNFVYAKRAGTRRIVLFGRAMRVAPPVFLRAPDDTLTISAHEFDETLTIMRRFATSGASAPTVLAPLDVMSLIRLLGNEPGVDPSGQPTGLGLDYGGVVGVLHQFCADRCIDATFILEQPNVAELFGPTRPVGREESEF